MILLGELSLWIALLMATWCAVVSIAGGVGQRRELIASGERALLATFAFSALAAAGLWTALLTRDFSLAYVASQISANMPDVYVFTALWSGPAGSMLLWASILALCAAVTVWTSRAANRDVMPFVTGTLAVVLVLLLGATALMANPFARADAVPLDGRGMNPLLQNPGMATHPPSLYLGLIVTAVPFAFALGALAMRRLDAQWIIVVRRWALLSWFFLTIGIVFGMWWAYVEQRSAWFRDPLESLSLLPWLTTTVFLLAMVLQERRGALRKWTVVLPVATFVLTIAGVARARGGIIEHVHSLARSPVVGVISAFLVVVIAASAWLLASRLGSIGMPSLRPRPTTKLRRGAGYIAWGGGVILLAALASLPLRREYEVSVAAGQQVEAKDAYGRSWRFVNQGISNGRSLNREVASATLEAIRDDKRRGLITSEQRQYLDSQEHPTHEPVTEAGIRAGALQDVYVELSSVRDEVADIRIAFNPLVMWVWIGGAIMALAGLVAMWPGAREGANS